MNHSLALNHFTLTMQRDLQWFQEFLLKKKTVNNSFIETLTTCFLVLAYQTKWHWSTLLRRIPTILLETPGKGKSFGKLKDNKLVWRIGAAMDWTLLHMLVVEHALIQSYTTWMISESVTSCSFSIPNSHSIENFKNMLYSIETSKIKTKTL